VVACNASKVSLLFKQAESCTSLRLIIKLGGAVTEEEKEKADQIGISIHTIQEVEVRKEGEHQGVLGTLLEFGRCPFPTRAELRGSKRRTL